MIVARHFMPGYLRVVPPGQELVSLGWHEMPGRPTNQDRSHRYGVIEVTLSPLTSHLSPLTFHLSPFTSHFSPLHAAQVMSRSS